MHLCSTQNTIKKRYGNIFQKQLPKLQNISIMEPNLEYKIPTIEQISDLLTDIASQLMTSGAHTMRIIQNVSRMAKTFGYKIDLSVFQQSIMMTISDKDDESKLLTKITKIKPLLLNFTIVSDLSALSWDTYDKK